MSRSRWHIRHALSSMALAVLATLAAWWVAEPAAAQLQAGRAYAQARVIADFELINAQGQSFGIDQWQGRWRLIFLGFSHCPAICPTTLARLQRVDQLLQQRLAPSDRPQVTFISVDPARDTPERLASYIAQFNPNFEAATGDLRQLAALAHQLGLIYRSDDSLPDSIDHSQNIVLLDRQARLVASFPPPHDPRALAEDLRRLIGG